MKLKKFTFKREEKLTGLMSIGAGPRGGDIKLGGKVCGSISFFRQTSGYGWQIKFAVQTSAFGAPYKWAWVRHDGIFHTYEEAREYVRQHNARLQDLYNLHFFEY